MTIHIPPWVIVLVVFLVPPYLLCRFGRRAFTLDAGEQLQAYFSAVLYWSGALGIFVGPYLFVDWLPALPAFFVGWAVALCLAFAGGYLDRRLTNRLKDQDRTRRVP